MCKLFSKKPKLPLAPFDIYDSFDSAEMHEYYFNWHIEVKVKDEKYITKKFRTKIIAKNKSEAASKALRFIKGHMRIYFDSNDCNELEKSTEVINDNK